MKTLAELQAIREKMQSQVKPIVEVMEPGKDKITYVKMNADKALEVVERHLVGGHPVEKYTMGAAGLK